METKTNNQEEDLFSFLTSIWKDFLIGAAPEINESHLVTEIEPCRGLKNRVTRRTNVIIEQHKNKAHKFGKSGQPPKRVEHNDYRAAPYSKMFLLYKSKSSDFVSEMEVYYIKKYKHHSKNDNVSEAQNHQMRSHNGYYYLYLAV